LRKWDSDGGGSEGPQRVCSECAEVTGILPWLLCSLTVTPRLWAEVQLLLLSIVALDASGGPFPFLLWLKL
jgi:hypothetical protein